METCKHGSGAGFRKPAAAMRQGVECRAYIVAASLGGVLLGLVGGSQVMMLVIAGGLLLCGALAVWNIKETYGEAHAPIREDFEPEI